jgi:glycosyltransferase involved in cell wall biosynthesis
VFFAPAYTAPLALRTPVVLTVHDVSFAAHPEWFRWREGVRRRWLTRWSARRARIVLTDTAFSAGEISARLDVPRDRVRVIPLGIDRRTAAERRREPIVLYVGTILNRRHVPDLIEAFAAVAHRQPNLVLVIAGDDRTYPPQDLQAVARRCGVGRRVDVRSYVSEDELRTLYASASVFVFLSEYEGFGFPPLEALAAGVPPVVGDTPVAREVCGAAAAFVPIGDLDRTAAAIELLLQDESARAHILAAGRAQLARYSWTEAARGTLQALEAGAGRAR